MTSVTRPCHGLEPLHWNGQQVILQTTDPDREISVFIRDIGVHSGYRCLLELSVSNLTKTYQCSSWQRDIIVIYKSSSFTLLWQCSIVVVYYWSERCCVLVVYYWNKGSFLLLPYCYSSATTTTTVYPETTTTTMYVLYHILFVTICDYFYYGVSWDYYYYSVCFI
jgi:hypothetical protein